MTCTIRRVTGDHFVKPCWMRWIDGWVTICEKSLGNQAASSPQSQLLPLKLCYCIWQQSAQIRTIWFILDGSPEHQLMKLLQTEHIYNPCIDIVWEDKHNKTLMVKVQLLQGKAAKLILDKAKHSSTTEAINELDWLVLSERRRQHRLSFVCKCMHGLIDWNFKFYALKGNPPL